MLLGRRLSRIVVLILGFTVVASILLFGGRARPVSAHATYAGECMVCHEPDPAIQVSANPILSENGQTTYEFNITGPYTGGFAYFIFTGTARVAYGYAASGTFTVPNGPTYTIYAVNKDRNNMPGSSAISVTPTGDASLWDQSHVEVFGRCVEGKAVFTLANIGQTMSGISTYRIFVNGVQDRSGSFQLGPMQAQTVTRDGSSGTVRLEANQRPLHPAMPLPSWDITGCVGAPPDLTPTALTATDPTIIGQSTTMAWTVHNQGTGHARDKWTDRLYLSSDNILSTDDILLGSLAQTTDLYSGDSYSASLPVKLPKITPGEYYLILKVDADEVLQDASYDDNVRALPIAVTAPDLMPTEIVAPDDGVSDQYMDLSWTVKNQGTGAALPMWIDRLYLSTDDAWSAEDIQITSYPQASALAAGDSYTRTTIARLPKVESGNYFLILKVDADGKLAESDEQDNSMTKSIRIGMADLTPTGITAPATGVADQYIGISWTVTNQGSDEARPLWTDRLYLSTDNTWSSADTQLSSYPQPSALAAGGSYTTTVTVRLPKVVTGDYYLIVKADADAKLYESDEENNTFVAPQTIRIGVPDIVPNGITAPESGIAYHYVEVSWAARNGGTGDATPVWTDRLYLSSDSAWSTDDLQVTSFPRSATLAVGDSYTVTLTVRLPKVASGSYYLILKADADGKLYESNEGNNAFVASKTIRIDVPDLTPTGITAPDTGAPGAYVNLSWTVRNQGTGSAMPTWTDRLYLSSDSAWSSNDVQLASSVRTAAAAANGDYTVSLTARVPSVTAGSYYLILRADADDKTYESNESNNTFVGSTTMAVTTP